MSIAFLSAAYSAITRARADGAPIRYLVPDAVAAQIEGRGLYAAYPGGRA